MIVNNIITSEQTVKQTYELYHSNNKKNSLFIRCHLGEQTELVSKLIDILVKYELSSGFDKSALGQKKIATLL